MKVYFSPLLNTTNIPENSVTIVPTSISWNDFGHKAKASFHFSRKQNESQFSLIDFLASLKIPGSATLLGVFSK